MKLARFSTAKKTKNETKPMCDSESTSKIRVSSPWTSQQLKSFAFQKFCMETRLYKIFKTKKATKLANPIPVQSFIK